MSISKWFEGTGHADENTCTDLVFTRFRNVKKTLNIKAMNPMTQANEFQR